MRVVRFFTTPAGGSAFDELEIPWGEPAEDPWGNEMRVGAPFASPAVRLFEIAAGAFQDWHNAPRRQLCFMLEGVWEIGDGRREAALGAGGGVPAGRCPRQGPHERSDRGTRADGVRAAAGRSRSRGLGRAVKGSCILEGCGSWARRPCHDLTLKCVGSLIAGQRLGA